jgi:cell division protein FtsB
MYKYEFCLQENSSLVEKLKAKAAELEKLKLSCINMNFANAGELESSGGPQGKSSRAGEAETLLFIKINFEMQENSSLVEDLKAKAAELEKLKLKNFQLEQQIYNVTNQHESSQR